MKDAEIPDGLLLHLVDKANPLSLMGKYPMETALPAFAPLKEFFQRLILLIHRLGNTIGGAGDLHMVPGFLRQMEGDGFPGEGIAVPVGKLEIIVAAFELGAVVYPGPGGFPDTVAALPPPALEVIGVVDLHLAHGSMIAGKLRRQQLRIIPTAAAQPFLPVLGHLPIDSGGFYLWEMPLGELMYRIVGKHLVKHRDVGDIPAADKVIGAGHVPAADDTGMGAKLVQAGGIYPWAVFLGREYAVEIEFDSIGFIPAHGDMGPGVRTGERSERRRHPGAGEVDIGDQRLKSGTVIIHPEKNVIPTGMIREGDPEYRERGGAYRVTGTPEKAEGAPLGVDIARAFVCKTLPVITAEIILQSLIGKNFHPLAEGGLCLRRGVVGGKTVFPRQIKQQPLRALVQLIHGLHAPFAGYFYLRL